MSINYSKGIPHDRNGEAQQGLPPNFPALAVSAGTPAASSVINFAPNTTTIEVAAGDNTIALKWGSSSIIAAAGTANYDHIIPINTVRRFVIPVNTQGVASVVGLGVQAGLYTSAALIVASSILVGTTEY